MLCQLGVCIRFNINRVASGSKGPHVVDSNEQRDCVRAQPLYETVSFHASELDKSLSFFLTDSTSVFFISLKNAYFHDCVSFSKSLLQV